MGVTSASLGLCGVVFSQIDDHFFTDNDYGLLIFMATVMAGVMGLGAFILGPLTPKSDNDQVAVNHDADENAPLLPSNQRPRDISGFEFSLIQWDFLFSSVCLSALVWAMFILQALDNFYWHFQHQMPLLLLHNIFVTYTYPSLAYPIVLHVL